MKDLLRLINIFVMKPEKGMVIFFCGTLNATNDVGENNLFSFTNTK